jgi:hypothetical protein
MRSPQRYRIKSFVILRRINWQLQVALRNVPYDLNLRPSIPQTVKISPVCHGSQRPFAILATAQY